MQEFLKWCTNASICVIHVLLTVVTQEWRGIPTRLNNIPHSREIRKYFYDDVLHATKHAIEDKKNRLQIDINIP